MKQLLIFIIILALGCKDKQSDLFKERVMPRVLFKDTMIYNTGPELILVLEERIFVSDYYWKPDLETIIDSLKKAMPDKNYKYHYIDGDSVHILYFSTYKP